MPNPFPERRDERIRVGKIDLHVTHWGGDEHGADDAIVFAHPTGFLGAVWKPLVARLRAAGIASRLITYDQRGHGLSSKPDDDYAWEVFVSDTAALLDALGVRRALGVGHSAGATTLAGVAADHPGLLRRIVMIDPVVFHPELARMMEGDANPMAARTRTRRIVWPSRDALYESFRRREPYDTWTDEALRAYVDEGTFERPDGEIELLCPARIEAQVYSAASSFDAFGRIAKAEVPMLFVRGERSITFDEDRANRAVELARDARLVTVPGTTHFVPMERPDEVAALVVAEHGAEA